MDFNAPGGFITVPMTLSTENIGTLLMGGSIDITDDDVNNWKRLFMSHKPFGFFDPILQTVFPAYFCGRETVEGGTVIVTLKVIIHTYIAAKPDYKNLLGLEINFETKKITAFI